MVCGGLILVTFFAAFMSTISTQMNWGASYLVCDVYQRFLVTQSPATVISRGPHASISLLVLLIGGVAAYLMRNISVDDAWKMLAALGAGTGAVFMLRWFWWRINAWSEIAAMLGSLVYYALFDAWIAALAVASRRACSSPAVGRPAGWPREVEPKCRPWWSPC